MKNAYLKIFRIFILNILFGTLSHISAAQCPGTSIPGNVAYDTTVSTGSGNYSTQFTFPKFDPQLGNITCIRICLTITGVVSMFLENNVTSAATYNISYNRKDTLTGPGLTTPLTNQVTKLYGPYNLAATDGIPFSGPDFISIGPDTVLNSVSFCRVLSDSTSVSQFYGPDSVTYAYKISAGAVVTGSGDYLFSIATTGLVNYHLEYCYCSPILLSLNLREFSIRKTAPDRAELSWKGNDNNEFNYAYVAEVSKNGSDFTAIRSLQKNEYNGGNSYYKVSYINGNNGNGNYFFRIKQVFAGGQFFYSEIRVVQLENSEFPKFSLYPNPSSGIVGIKFVNISGGKMNIRVMNIQGQTVVNEEVIAEGSFYRQIGTLQKGIYWIRLTDLSSHLFSVSQLVIK